MILKSRFGCVRIFKNKLSTQNRCSFHENINGVQIPARIERGPTDILKELSRTAALKSGNINYKAQYGIIWHNLNSFESKTIGMSFESGRKAAKWVVSQNPELFQHRVAEPYIEAFAPPKILDKTSEVSEETLINAIKMINVEYAIDVYNLLKEKGIDVSMSTKQQLLELVCYYNCTNKQDVTLIETKYYANLGKISKNTWKENGFHMQLFNEMEHNAQSYSAVILGSSKHGSHKLALDLYNRAKEEGIKFGTAVYNAILLQSYNRAENFFHGEVVVLKIFKEMAALNVEPNLETLNSALCCIATMRRYYKSRNFALKILNEFRRIGIKPSLTTYNQLMVILFSKVENYTNLDPPTRTFTEILNEIENNTFQVEDEHDFYFFAKAMSIACSLKNLNLAKRVDKILNTGNNRIFLNGFSSNLLYYRSFLSIVFKCGTVEEALELYDRITSFWAVDERSYLEILSTLRARKDGGLFIPFLWKQLKKLRTKMLIKCMNLFLTILDEKGHQISDNMDLEIAKEIWKGSEGKSLYDSWDSENLSKIISIFCRKGEKELAYEVFDFVSLQVQKHIQLNFSSVILFVKFCFTCNDKEKALECIKYLCKNQYPCTAEFVGFIKSNFKLDESDLNLLKALNAKSLMTERDDAVLI